MVESTKDDGKKKWIKIYPIYIDKAVKVSEGRKVSLAYAAENPTAKNIYDVCTQFLGLNCKIEEVYFKIIKIEKSS